jgi:hypothetical protein
VSAAIALVAVKPTDNNSTIRIVFRIPHSHTMIDPLIACRLPEPNSR